VTNGIHLFEPDPGLRMEVRDRLGIPRDAVLIVLVSRATFYKGLDFAVRAMARLLDAPGLGGRVYAVHCGDGPDAEACSRLAAESGIGDYFRFLGRRSDVRVILGAADIAFHPSRGEAMSLAILEFMCAGLAVLTSDLPSVSTAIDRGVTGLTYAHGSLEDAAAALRRLVDDPALRRELGTAAAAACRERYGLDTMNDTFMARVVPSL
jgi:glycosyltransferase involved in cell wall biosynthesis